MTYNAYFFLNNVDLGCSLKLKFNNSFGKYDPTFSKNPFFLILFLETPCTSKNYRYFHYCNLEKDNILSFEKIDYLANKQLNNTTVGGLIALKMQKPFVDLIEIIS